VTVFPVDQSRLQDEVKLKYREVALEVRKPG
jgi:hypothetical protein